MAKESGGGAGPFFAFLTGGLLVTVVVLGFFLVTGHMHGNVTSAPAHVSLNFKAPATR